MKSFRSLQDFREVLVCQVEVSDAGVRLLPRKKRRSSWRAEEHSGRARDRWSFSPGGLQQTGKPEWVASRLRSWDCTGGGS